MKGRVVTFLFYNTIAQAFQYPIPQNGSSTVVNAVDNALQGLGITGTSINWEMAFARIVEKHAGEIRLKDAEIKNVVEQKDKDIEKKDEVIHQLNVLNFIGTHMEKFSLQLDPLHCTTKRSTPQWITMNKAAISTEDIPTIFQGRLEADFKNAYARRYRIIMNSDDPRITRLLAILKEQEPFNKTSLSEQDVAKILATLWCNVCNDVHSILRAAKDRVSWQNEDEVAEAFTAFEDDGFYIDFVRVFFKATKFWDHVVVKKNKDAKVDDDKNKHVSD